MVNGYIPARRKSKSMAHNSDYGVGLWIFGKVADRFVPEGYRPAYTIEERIKAISEIPLVRGVELSYPSDFHELAPEELVKKLENANICISMLNVDLFSHPKWQRGSISSLNESIRKDAINIIKECIDLARRIGVSRINLWLGQDGHDYLFSNHRDRWKYLISSLKEVSNYLGKNQMLFLEYKHKEPRTHLLVSNVGKTLHIIDRVGTGNLGVTIDTGHALMVDENLAESVYVIHDAGVELALHLNDAYGYWDDDMAMCSINFFKFIEFFYALEDVNYNGWYDLDIYPYREDPVKACEQSIKIIDYIRKKIKEHYQELRRVIELDDPLKALDFVWKMLLKDF
ncbi:MAG: sugar phosphate isomerase/epimerase family protein [Nitrososphaerota archaeon]